MAVVGYGNGHRGNFIILPEAREGQGWRRMTEVIREVSSERSGSNDYVRGTCLNLMVVAQPQQKHSYRGAPVKKRHS